jgi:hypothetical protein
LDGWMFSLSFFFFHFDCLCFLISIPFHSFCFASLTSSGLSQVAECKALNLLHISDCGPTQEGGGVWTDWFLDFFSSSKYIFLSMLFF